MAKEKVCRSLLKSNLWKVTLRIGLPCLQRRTRYELYTYAVMFRYISTGFADSPTVAWLIEKGYSVICFSKPSKAHKTQ